MNNLTFSGFDGWEDVYLAGRVVRSRDTAPAALAAIVASGAAVEIGGDDGPAVGDKRYAELLARGAEEVFVGPGRGRFLEDAVRRGRYALDRTRNTDERFRLVVVGRDVVVADRPSSAPSPSRS